jgi:hydrogenase expression/formation protein HypC
MMCIGIPMQVVESGPIYAWCEGMGERRQIDMRLVGDAPAGQWVLVFLDSARELLTEQDAVRISDALRALELTMQGEVAVDHLFADLIDREPELPVFLQTGHEEKSNDDVVD